MLLVSSEQQTWSFLSLCDEGVITFLLLKTFNTSSFSALVLKDALPIMTESQKSPKETFMSIYCPTTIISPPHFTHSASILVWWVSSPHSQVKPSIWTLANSVHSGFRLLWFLFSLLYQFPPPLWAVFFKTKPPEASLHETKPSEASLQKTKRSSTQKPLVSTTSLVCPTLIWSTCFLMLLFLNPLKSGLLFPHHCSTVGLLLAFYEIQQSTWVLSHR